MLVEQPDVIFGELLWSSSIIKKEPGGLSKRDVEIAQERITGRVDCTTRYIDGQIPAKHRQFLLRKHARQMKRESKRDQSIRL